MPVKRRAPSYKWVALSNTTLGVLLATIDGSIVLIAMPDIFRGIHLDPLQPGNSFYLLWMILGFLIVTSVLVVSFGRLGDLRSHKQIYVAGFGVFVLGSAFCGLAPSTGALIGARALQALGAAMLLANAPAILTGSFPAKQRGQALGLHIEETQRIK